MPDSKFGVRITKLVDGKEQEFFANYESIDYDLAKRHAEELVQDDDIVAAEVVSQFSDQELEELHEKWNAVVLEFGEQETFQMIERVVMTRGLSNKNKARTLEHHPAYQLLKRPRQKQITFHFDEENILYLTRRLLSTLAVLHDFAPLSQRAPQSAWFAVIYKLREVYHPTGERSEKSRAERERARMERRQQRLEDAPTGMSGKGGDASKKGFDGGNTPNARKRQRTATTKS